MGYTGAIFKDYFGTRMGFMIALGIMFCWMIVPAWVSVRRFNRKDL
jgi:Cu-processing system permease protein